MATQRQRTGNRPATHPMQQPAADKFPARLFPIQHEIQKLREELSAFNERIVELENEGRGTRARSSLAADVPVAHQSLGLPFAFSPSSASRISQALVLLSRVGSTS